MLTSAFTCTGPYAVLIMLGIKRVENRGTMPGNLSTMGSDPIVNSEVNPDKERNPIKCLEPKDAR